MHDPSIPVTSTLNPAQADAVAHAEGPLLVFAGAGSGKTRVIINRIANLITKRHVPPYRILAVTFTNKAAGEMRARLESLLGPSTVREAWVGTFHATCARLLRRYCEAVGLKKDFLIYDDSDQRSVVGRVLRELGYDDRRYPPRVVLSRIMQEKQEGRGPADFVPGTYVDDAVRNVFEGYERYLRASNAVDFEDLIGMVTRIAEDGSSMAGRELQERFAYVLVDEFQDTNRIQYRLVRALASRHHNLCVVGDDDQSIYRWRGGDVKLIRGFKHDFPEVTVVKLEQNYRSTGHIVQSALGVIKPSREREPKELFTRNDPGAPVRVVALRDEREEAAYVVARAREAIEAGIEPTEIAVFYRIHAMSRVIEEVFRLEGVPYRIVGGTRFFDRAEVKDLLSYLRMALNPRSDVDFMRIVNTPARGIGATTVDRLMQHAARRGTSMYDALDSLGETELGAAPKKKLAAFRALLDGFREAHESQSPSDLARRVLAETGYSKALEAENTAEADARIENLEELVASMQEYEDAAEASGERPSLAGYLERVSLASSPDEEKSLPRVSLMTVHSAKGLEYKAVFLVGMEEQIFPYERRGDENGCDEEEERRLAYVAITRAREQLFLLHTANRTLFGNTRCGGPSRFLHDLPAESVQHIKTYQDSPAQADRGYGGGYGGYGARRYGGDQNASRARYGNTTTERQSSWGERPAVAPQGPARRPGERYVERDETSHAPAPAYDGDGAALRGGARVKHARFGEGVVQSVDSGVDPSVVVRFPGWGEKKVLVRFLQPA